MSYCKFCGNEIPDGARKCNECGKEVVSFDMNDNANNANRDNIFNSNSEQSNNPYNAQNTVDSYGNTNNAPYDAQNGTNPYGAQYNNEGYGSPYGNQVNNSYSNQKDSDDTGSVGWLFLGCLIPIVGLVLYIIWKKERPKDAKQAIKGFIISIVASIIIYIITYVIALNLFSRY